MPHTDDTLTEKPKKALFQFDLKEDVSKNHHHYQKQHTEHKLERF